MMLLQPKQMLAEGFEWQHHADSTTASASSWQCVTAKGNEVTRVSLVDAQGQCLLNELVKPESRVVNYCTRSLAQTFLISLSFRAAALSNSGCSTESPWFAEMLAAFPSVLRIQFLLCGIVCSLLHSAHGATRQDYSAVSMGKICNKLTIHSTCHSSLLVIKEDVVHS